MEVVVFVGLPGAGKTTFYRERFAATHAHVSKDQMAHRSGKQERQMHAIERLLREGRSIVVDNTSPSRADRAPIVATARAHGAACAAYFFDATPAECLERNAKREGKGKVPPVAIFASKKRLQPPALDEGFDAVYRVTLDASGFVVAEVR